LPRPARTFDRDAFVDLGLCGPPRTDLEDRPGDCFRTPTLRNAAPFGASIGPQPALGADDIADLIAFLETLTDEPHRDRAADDLPQPMSSSSSRWPQSRFALR